jgi:hypothetical protein
MSVFVYPGTYTASFVTLTIKSDGQCSYKEASVGPDPLMEFDGKYEVTAEHNLELIVTSGTRNVDGKSEAMEAGTRVTQAVDCAYLGSFKIKSGFPDGFRKLC